MKKTTAAKKATQAPTIAETTVDATTTASPAKKAIKGATKAKAANPAKKAAEVLSGSPAKPTSKKDAVLALVSRKAGATLEEIMAATGWQKHTVRGFIRVLGKAGTKIESSKSEGTRTYKAA